MKRYTIEQKFKSAAAFLVILILFPYIVSVFVNGVDPEETTNENFYIRVKASEEEEADGIAEVEWNEYLTGVLAKDVPADTETEALKAQAVLVRTGVMAANGIPVRLFQAMRPTPELSFAVRFMRQLLKQSIRHFRQSLPPVRF